MKPNPNDFITAVTANKRYATEEHSLRFQGLEGLVIILRTLLRTANLWSSIGETATSGGPKRQSLSDPYSVIASLSYEERSSAVDNDMAAETDEAPTGNVVTSGSEVTSPAPPESTTVSAVENFDRKQKIQEEIETGILKFNISPKQGLKYLSQLHHIEHTPQGVASFLLQYQDRLDKTAVGEYLGREREYENGFCIQVLHEYVEAMDFTNMAFDLAIRYFLAGFRLPGEAQKIDRLMEKFAERYYLQNRDKFASADMAFILAFSTIMLQTNLHNPAIREDKRMTKEQFIKQNKGISQDGELSDELLIEIYDRISAQPISITQNEKETRKVKKEEPTGFAVFQPSLLDKKRKEAFDDERKEMVRASEEMFKQSNRKDNIFLRTGNDARSDEAYAKPMFEIAWPPILGALSFVLETHDDPAIIELTLRAFKYAIRLACRLDFPIARHTFVNALSKFTTLDTVRTIEYKHLESIKAFVDVALSEGDWLDETWNPVLQTVSQLARLQMFADGSQGDDIFYNDSTSASSNERTGRKQWSRKSGAGSTFAANIDQFTKIFSGPTKAEQVRNVEETNSELIIREIDPALVDKIFVNSPGLSEGSVYHFVKSLCEVSMLEISGGSAMTSLRGKDGNVDITTPRVFSLQKLVEVADFNMGSRPRIAWANIWNLLAQHFMAVGVNDNYALAMFAVDSLKQLSIKFLQKEELSNFNFQRVFLKPFEIIMTHCKAIEIKDLVLRCIDIMILACASNIRSGWKSIFAIFEVATRESTEIATIAFNITERLINKNFDLLVYDFVELINCLVAFVACPHAELSLRALHYLANCSNRLVDGSVDMTAAESKHYNPNAEPVPSTQPVDEDASVFRLWWPLLLGLSTAVGDYRLSVRIKALETLQKVLLDHGKIFSPQAWGVIFKGILFPMLDSAKTDSTPQPESSWPAQNPVVLNSPQGWIGTMATPVFNIYIDLFKEFEERVSPVLFLSDLMKVIEDCICQDNESLARIAVRVYNDLITSLGVNAKGEAIGLSEAVADLVCTRLCASLSHALCFDFGDLGVLDLVDNVPSEISSQVRGGAPASRRKSKEENMHVYDSPIKTPYGNGHIEKVIVFYKL